MNDLPKYTNKSQTFLWRKVLINKIAHLQFLKSSKYRKITTISCSLHQVIYIPHIVIWFFKSLTATSLDIPASSNTTPMPLPTL